MSPLGGFHILTGSTAAYDVTDLDSFDQCKHYTDDTLVGESLTISCDVTRLARYVAIIRRASDVRLHFCEVEVLAALGAFSVLHSFYNLSRALCVKLIASTD